MEKQRILVVDDDESTRLIMRTILETEYEVLLSDSGSEALYTARHEKPDLILLDIIMPGLDGFETCRALKAELRTREIPVIFVTSLGDVKDETQGFQVGGADYIMKPVNPALLRARINIHLRLYHQQQALRRQVAEATSEILATQRVIIERLGKAAEYRDDLTGQHVVRMSLYTGILARAAGLSDEEARTLELAAPMHDIGKIKIPDDILKRPGKLSADEMSLMREHARFGAELIGHHHSHLLQLARTVAIAHHEKWDGSGYPEGLARDKIPLEARLVAIADVFDALTSPRPYKPAWTIEDAIKYIESQAGKHFDPELAPLLRSNLKLIEEVYYQHSDLDHPEAANTSVYSA